MTKKIEANRKRVLPHISTFTDGFKISLFNSSGKKLWEKKNTINMIFFPSKYTDFQLRKLLFYGVNKCISTHTLFRGYFLINDVTEKDLQ